MCLTKHLIRYAVITGLVGGTAAVVAGPDRLGALFQQAQSKINTCIDNTIDDPIALRSQMKQLEGQYPERIAEVRGDLAELNEQVAQLKRELAVSDRVVSLTNVDIEQMQTLITRGEAAQSTMQLASDSLEFSPARAQIIRVVFNGESIDLKDAYTRANKIQQVRVAYANRANEINRDLGYLGQQESRLTQLATQLDTEYQEFQAQMWQMDRQVDTISRNERLITMMEKRQRTLDDQGRYGADSLQQLSSRFTDIRAKQEARLETLGQSSNAINYEDRAKFDLDARKQYGSSQSLGPVAPVMPQAPTVIEITPESPSEGPVAKPASFKAVAYRK